MQLDKARYLQLFENNLKRYFTSVYLEVEEFLELKFSPEVEIIDFIMVNTVDGTNIMIYCMNSEGEEVHGCYGESCFSGSEKLLENIALFKVPEEFDEESFFESHPEVEHEELELIQEWFLKAFQKGNGENFKLPCFFGFSDDIKSFDLKKQKWVLNSSEKWS